MTASFPSSIKSYTTKIDNVTQVLAEDVNSPQEEIVAIETLLGVNGLSWIGEGQMMNGFIQASVSSNNLTVQIRTMAGTAPSASAPVYARINGTIRKITAALSVTKIAGTNWCDAGSAELATYEQDYFVYLGYNATDGVLIGFSRIPYGTRYDSFSATATNQRYCAISTITNAAAADYYTVIGRFAATLSAGAGYTWSVPTFTNDNLIQRPIFETRILSWLPSWTNVTVGNATQSAYYQIYGRWCKEKSAFTLGSTSSVTGAATHTLPISRVTTYYSGSGGPVLGFVRYSDTGSAIYEGVPLSNAATTIGFYAKVASGTYISLATISGTVPHTWANTDLIEDWLDYELA